MAQRWRGRPLLSVAVRLAIFVVPVGGAVFAARAVVKAVPAVGGPARAGRLLLALLVSLLVVDLLERVMKRFLPLAGLLRLSMAFPDRAPSRFDVARRASSLRDLDARLADARARGISDEPVRAAEEVLALVAALSSHDRRTRGHSERVRVFTDLLAGELGLNKGEADRLRWAALLHDVGKLRVDPALLNKSGTPDADEWVALREHPRAGAAIVAPLRGWLGEWAHAVEHHHERWDGDGYPDGLAGADVPYAARAVSVTDAFETMTAARAYKRPMTAAGARSTLVRDAGTHFDPAMVRAFLGVSLWRLRWAMGPVSWLAQIPLIGEIPKLGPAVSKVGDGAILGAKLAVAGVSIAVSGATANAAPARGTHDAPLASGIELVEWRPGFAPVPERAEDGPALSVPQTHPSGGDEARSGDEAHDGPERNGDPTNPLDTNPLPNDPLRNGRIPPAIDNLKRGTLKSATDPVGTVRPVAKDPRRAVDEGADLIDGLIEQP